MCGAVYMGACFAALSDSFAHSLTDLILSQHMLVDILAHRGRGTSLRDQSKSSCCYEATSRGRQQSGRCSKPGQMRLATWSGRKGRVDRDRWIELARLARDGLCVCERSDESMVGCMSCWRCAGLRCEYGARPRMVWLCPAVVTGGRVEGLNGAEGNAADGEDKHIQLRQSPLSALPLSAGRSAGHFTVAMYGLRDEPVEAGRPALDRVDVRGGRGEHRGERRAPHSRRTAT